MRQQCLAVHAAVSHGGFFRNRIHAVGRGNQGGARGRDQAALHRAPGFHQLGGNHDIHVTGHGHERQHGPSAVAGIGEQFHVVNRRTRALRHTRYRGALRVVAIALAQIDQPIG